MKMILAELCAPPKKTGKMHINMNIGTTIMGYSPAELADIEPVSRTFSLKKYFSQLDPEANPEIKGFLVFLQTLNM